MPSPPGGVFFSSRPDFWLLSGTVADRIIGVLVTGVATRHGISEGHRSAGTTRQQAGSHEAGRCGDAHTRTHGVSILQGVSTRLFRGSDNSRTTTLNGLLWISIYPRPGHTDTADDPEDSVGLHHQLLFHEIADEMTGRPAGMSLFKRKTRATRRAEARAIKAKAKLEAKLAAKNEARRIKADLKAETNALKAQSSGRSATATRPHSRLLKPS